MKKFLLFALVLVSAVAAKAQVYVGGELGFWHNNDEPKTTQFTIMPEIGYNFNEKWAAGVEIGYQYNKAGDTKINTFAINPYARYTYFKSGIVSLFVDGGVDFAVLHNEESYTAFGIGFKPGIALNVTENAGFVAHFGFIGYQDADDEISEFVDKGFGLDLSSKNLSFGFFYNF